MLTAVVRMGLAEQTAELGLDFVASRLAFGVEPEDAQRPALVGGKTQPRRPQPVPAHEVGDEPPIERLFPREGASDRVEDGGPHRRVQTAGGVEGSEQLRDRAGMVVDLEPGAVEVAAHQAVTAAIEADDVDLEAVAQPGLGHAAALFEVVDETHELTPEVARDGLDVGGDHAGQQHPTEPRSGVGRQPVAADGDPPRRRHGTGVTDLELSQEHDPRLWPSPCETPGVNVGVFSLMQWPQDRTAEAVYANEIAQAVEAERLGFDRAWFAEHHFSRYGIAPAIHLLLAHVAALTSRIRLGTAVTIVPFMHPIRIAEELAMCDILSGGRIDWGAGRGYQRHEFDAFGVPIAESRGRFQETLEIIFKAWADGPVEHHGRFWDFDAVDVLPKPVQQPRIPTWVATISPESVRWAAGEGLPILVDQFSPFSRIVETHKEFEAARRDAGFGDDPVETPVLRQLFVGRTREEARAIAGPALLWYYRTLAKVGSPARAGEALPEGYEVYDVFSKLSGWTATPEDADGFVDVLLDQVAICGSPEEVVDRLTAVHEVGYSAVMCWMNFGGIPHEETLSSMRRFADDVAPNLPR